MWIVPKQIAQNVQTSCEEEVSHCVTQLTVRGSYTSLRVWNTIRLSKNAWSRFIFGHIADALDFTEATSVLKPHIEGSVHSTSHTAEPTNVWEDLPLFCTAQEVSHLFFCKMSEPYWTEWDISVSSSFKKRCRAIRVCENRWATPTVRDFLDSNLHYALPLRKDGKTRMDGVARQALHISNYEGPLNPRWLEPIMGIQIGWVRPSHTLKSKHPPTPNGNLGT